MEEDDQEQQQQQQQPQLQPQPQPQQKLLTVFPPPPANPIISTEYDPHPYAIHVHNGILIGGAGTGNGPQQYYVPHSYPPPHFHPNGPQMPLAPQHTLNSISHMPQSLQPSYLKSERAQRQHNKLKRKVEQRNNESRNNSLGFNSSHSTPAPSPRKEFSNGVRGRGPGSIVGGTSSEGEGSSSAATSVQGDEEAVQPIVEYLSSLQIPLVTDVTSRSAIVHWNTPRPPEGSSPPPFNGEITYELLLGEKGRYKAIYLGQALSCRVEDLRPGVVYSMCLQAHAEDYTGAASEAAIVETPPCEPAAPIGLRVTSKSRTSLQLRWSSPADNGAHIQHYILQYDEGKGGEFVDLFKARNKQHNMQKLEPSTKYRLRFAAVNEVGRGPWSEEYTFSTSGSPPLPPAPPVLVNATPCSLLLHWERRPGDEEFSLQMEDEHNRHGFLVVYAGRDIESNCDKLKRCSNYKFRLQANNDEGSSRWSEEVVFRTLPETPQAPSKPVVKGKILANMFKVKWEPPGDRGGTEIQHYTLEINSGNGFETVYVGSEQESICDRLSPGCAYQVRVSCVTAGGVSNWSDIQTITTEPVVPGPCLPPNIASDPKPYSVTINWQMPEYNGGSPVLEYDVEMNHKESSRLMFKGKETECTIQELLPGRKYSFRVKAFNRVGGGAWSEYFHTTTRAAPPDIPNAPRIIGKTPYSVMLQWDEPECNGGPIGDYQLEMANSKGDVHFMSVYQGPLMSFDVKNLTPYTSYYFKVCASNKSGTSKWSDLCEVATPGAAPASPASLSVEATATEIHLSWLEPLCNGYPIQFYKIDIGDRVITTEEPILEHLIQDLMPETVYKIRVQAVNEIGVGNYSPMLKVETLPPPPPPPSISCIQQGHNFLKLKWGEGKNLDFTQYIVEMQSSRRRDYQVVYEGTSLFFRVKKLQESTKYKFRICASNDAGGQGDFSEDFEFETTPAPPATVKIPRQVEVNENSVSIEWCTTSKTPEEHVTYIVQCSRTKELEFKQVYKGTETSFVIEDLESGTEYTIRVCGEREIEGTVLHGPWSPTLSVLIPAAPPPVQVTSAPPVPRRTPRRSVATFFMKDDHYAVLFTVCIIIISVVLAIVTKQFIDSTKSV